MRPIIAPIAVALALLLSPVPSPGQSPADALQATVNAARPIAPYGAVSVPLPPGRTLLDHPVVVPSDRLLTAAPDLSRLKTSGCFPSLLFGVKLAQPADATFDGVCLDLADSPAHLGLPGPGQGGQRLAYYDDVRRVRILFSAARLDPSWTRSGLLGYQDAKPRPWLMYVESPNSLCLDTQLATGARARHRLSLPADVPDLDLDLAIDLDAGSVSATVNGTPAAVRAVVPIPPGSRLKRPEWAPFRVAPWASDDLPSGRFTLRSLAIELDGVRSFQLDPAPDGRGFWRWTQPGTRRGIWGLGLCLPTNPRWGNGDTTHRSGARGVEFETANDWPYGSNVAFGLANRLKLDGCRFVSGAHGIRQVVRDTSYLTEVRDCDFHSHADACLSLDYGMVDVRDVNIEIARGMRSYLRLHRTGLRLSGGFAADEPLEYAIDSADTQRVAIDGFNLDWENPPYPLGMFRFERGQANGGRTVVSVANTPSARIADGGALVTLIDNADAANRVSAGAGYGSFSSDALLATAWQTTPPQLVQAHPTWVASSVAPYPPNVTPAPVPTPPIIVPPPIIVTPPPPILTPPVIDPTVGPAPGPVAPMPPMPGTPRVGSEPRPGGMLRAPSKRLPRRRVAA